ncbi:MAG: hypothetical protein GF398_11065 [Chitinivibrionales bacterium]|nr:hypothetical protein [Chitinivibrionales bacterium]
MAASSFLICPACQAPFDHTLAEITTDYECRQCSTRMQVTVFPAFYRKPQVVSAQKVVEASQEAACYHHADKRAVVACDSCGKFLCSLCEIEIDKHRLCPDCLSREKMDGDNKNLQTGNVLYDKIALVLALYPLLLIFAAYFTVITAPIALFITLRYWKKQRSIVPRSSIRFAIAFLLSVLEIIGWILIGIFIYYGLTHSRGE